MNRGRWARVARPRVAWGVGGGSLVLMAVGLVLLVLSRQARFPPSMDPWDEQALVILEFLGAPILGGLIAGRRPRNLYGWLWCVIGLGVGLDALVRGYATYGLVGRPGSLPGATVVAWAGNFSWILGLGCCR
jgi:two-component system NarL family sensor kinase